MWRAAKPEDHARVVALYLALNEEDPCEAPPDPARTRRTLEVFRNDPGRGICLVLDEGAEELQGYALLVSYWSNELGGNLTHLDEVFVVPSARGRGHGGALIALLAAGQVGWPETVGVQLEVSPANRRARGLYERSGFAALRNLTLRRRL